MTMPTETRTMIRPLHRDELPLCVPFAQAFHREFQIPGELIPRVWLANWGVFLNRYPAVILSRWVEGVLVGGLGAMVIPDLCDGRLCGQEMFWFVHPEYRGGLEALELVKYFEAWAATQGAVEARLSHLHGGLHDDVLQRLYTKRWHYRKMETSFVKSLVSPIEEPEEALCQSSAELSLP